MDFKAIINSWGLTLGDKVPGILAAILTLIIGHFIAKFLEKMSRKLFGKAKLDERIASTSGTKANTERALSRLVYFVIMIFVLISTMESLGIGSILDPIRDMGAKFLGVIPNLVGAGLIGYIGYTIAQIIAGLVSSGANFVDGLSEKIGLNTDLDLVKILRTLVFALVFIPFLIAALDTLEIAAVTEPLKNMLNDFLNALPRLLATIVIIGAFYIGGRFIAGILRDLLNGFKVNEYSDRLGLGGIIGEGTSMAALLANVAFFFIMFFGIITSVEQLGYASLNGLLSELLEMIGRVAFGLVILVVGNWLAQTAYQMLSKGDNDNFVASIGRIVVLALFLAIALRTMGIANDIVNLAFGLCLGAVAVAFAISFGLGGREAAGEEMQRFFKRLRK